MAAYAEGTTVAPEKSRADIEAVLRKYGATSFVSGFDERQAVVQFEAQGRRVRFLLTIPAPADDMFRYDGRKNARSPQQRQVAAAAEERRRWRTLLIAIKAKLDVVESGIATFEEEFAAHIVLPNGSTVGDWLGPQIESAYRSGTMPTMLALGDGS